MYIRGFGWAFNRAQLRHTNCSVSPRGYTLVETPMTHDPYPELDDEIPTLSLAASFAMALVIALFRPAKRALQYRPVFVPKRR